LINLAVGYLEK